MATDDENRRNRDDLTAFDLRFPYAHIRDIPVNLEEPERYRVLSDELKRQINETLAALPGEMRENLERDGGLRRLYLRVRTSALLLNRTARALDDLENPPGAELQWREHERRDDIMKAEAGGFDFLSQAPGELCEMAAARAAAAAGDDATCIGVSYGQASRAHEYVAANQAGAAVLDAAGDTGTSLGSRCETLSEDGVDLDKTPKSP